MKTVGETGWRTQWWDFLDTIPEVEEPRAQQMLEQLYKKQSTSEQKKAVANLAFHSRTAHIGNRQKLWMKRMDKFSKSNPRKRRRNGTDFYQRKSPVSYARSLIRTQGIEKAASLADKGSRKFGKDSGGWWPAVFDSIQTIKHSGVYARNPRRRVRRNLPIVPFVKGFIYAKIGSNRARHSVHSALGKKPQSYFSWAKGGEYHELTPAEFERVKDIKGVRKAKLPSDAMGHWMHE